MEVSIIIPVWNESENIARLLKRLQEGGGQYLKEIFVVDAGSTDDTVCLAQEAGAKVLHSPHKGRASQMNFGAQYATGELLYFVHGDTLPPPCYMKELQQALKEGYPIGCFRFQFESKSPFLAINSYCTRFDRLWCRGGDQSLFITQKLFEELNGFQKHYKIMEDYDIIIRARKKYPFKIIPKSVLVSARKYETNPYLWVQLSNLIVFTMYRLGYSQEAMATTYKRLLNYRND